MLSGATAEAFCFQRCSVPGQASVVNVCEAAAFAWAGLRRCWRGSFWGSVLGKAAHDWIASDRDGRRVGRRLRGDREEWADQKVAAKPSTTFLTMSGPIRASMVHAWPDLATQRPMPLDDGAVD